MLSVKKMKLATRGTSAFDAKPLKTRYGRAVDDAFYRRGTPNSSMEIVGTLTILLESIVTAKSARWPYAP